MGRRASGVTSDISLHGLFARTRDFLPAGEIVELYIYLDELVPVRIVSRVVHVLATEAARALGREAGMGFQFLERESVRLEALRRQLSEYIDSSRTPAPASDQHLVVADSSVRLVERLVSVLSSAGFHVTPAGTGAEVYELALSKPLDGILTADFLPVMDGWTLLKRLKAHPQLAGIPVAMTSSAEGDLTLACDRSSRRRGKVGIHLVVPGELRVADEPPVQ
jgi:CheY-like chemotaxis protein